MRSGCWMLDPVAILDRLSSKKVPTKDPHSKQDILCVMGDGDG